MHVFPPAVIDRDGLHKSNLRGLREALWACQPADVCLVDGFKLGPTAPPHRAVVDGDEKSAAIAAASIVAKVTRDRYMRTADAVYPAYGFSSHVGYITPAHSAVVRRIGPSRDPPPLVPRALLRTRGRRRARRGRSLGTGAERRAARWYRLRAYRILDTNAWLAGGELDVVARRGRDGRLLRGEVEVGRRLRRPARDGDAEKVRRVRRAAEAWLARHPAWAGLAVRFDVIVVRGRRLERIAVAF